jgi:hypothetical protein
MVIEYDMAVADNPSASPSPRGTAFLARPGLFGARDMLDIAAACPLFLRES